MRAVDTNIIVRLIARDDERQLAIARHIVAGGDLLILPTVLLEAEWVLRARYGLDRSKIADGLETVCGQEGVTVRSSEAVAAALSAFRVAGDYADLLHHALAAQASADGFLTFDRSFGAANGGPALRIL